MTLLILLGIFVIWLIMPSVVEFLLKAIFKIVAWIFSLLFGVIDKRISERLGGDDAREYSSLKNKFEDFLDTTKG